MTESWFFYAFVFIYKHERWKTTKKSENPRILFFIIKKKQNLYSWCRTLAKNSFVISTLFIATVNLAVAVNCFKTRRIRCFDYTLTLVAFSQRVWGACEKWAELESEAVNYLWKLCWCKIPYKGNSCSLNTFNCCNFHSRLMDNFSQFALWIREWNNCFHEIVEGSKSVSYVLQKQEIHLEKYFLQMAATFLVLEETANFSPHPETKNAWRAKYYWVKFPAMTHQWSAVWPMIFTNNSIFAQLDGRSWIWR